MVQGDHGGRISCTVHALTLRMLVNSFITRLDARIHRRGDGFDPAHDGCVDAVHQRPLAVRNYARRRPLHAGTRSSYTRPCLAVSMHAHVDMHACMPIHVNLGFDHGS